MSRFGIAAAPVDVAALQRTLQQPGSGGFCSFEGWVRDSNEGQPVSGLDYEAYDELALSEGERIIEEALARYPISDARCVHRTGALAVGDLAVWVGVAAAHRDAAFRACRYIIDEIKHRLPIWKREHYLSGAAAWVACSHTERAHEHEDSHGHHHRDQAPAGFAPDYSRQVRLREVGEAGQSRLAASRVLVIGAGGLGCPVLSYLAGAGVGTLGIVDGDRVDASNLHRQTLYTAADVGQRKVDAAARRLRALNPAVVVNVYPEPLRADNATAVFAEYDLVVECTDDMRSRYLSSDAAVLTGKPAIFASVYQYEGQLHVYGGRDDAPCLRCLWPQAPDPAVVGTCADAGVLGPVVGVLGSLQAAEALKRLLGLPGQDGSLALVDLLDLDLRRIELPSARECACAAQGGCAAVARRALAEAAATEELELAFASLEDARAAGFQLVDVREPAEIAAEPLPVEARPLPSGQLAGHAGDFAEGRFLLVCASGRRSLHAAQGLRAAGAAGVRSLAGGLAALRAAAVATH